MPAVRLLRCVALVAALLVSVSCGGGSGTMPPPPPPPPPTTVETLTIHGMPASLEAGADVQLSVVSRNVEGSVVANPALNWTSSVPSVASVTARGGRVTGVAAGQTTIRVSGADRDAEAVLTVSATTATAVSLLPATVALAPAAQVQLSSAVLGANGVIPGLPLTFASGDVAVATVDAAGRVTATGTGRTTITARYGSLTQVTGVTVSTFSQNLRVARADIIQVAQTAAANVPLVQGKPSALRVYPVASQSGASGIPIDVKLERNGVTVFAQRVQTGAIRTTFDPLLDGAAIYLPLPIGLDLDGITISARIDPDDGSAEANEWDNDFPLFRDPPITTTSLELPQIRVRLVPMAPLGQPAPSISTSVAAELVAFMNLIYPSVGIDVEVHGALITSHADWNSSSGVGQALNQLAVRRTEDGSSAFYYGVTSSAEINGAAGWGRQPGTVSMGWADPEIVAHEVGHNFGLAHPVGCGNGTPGAPGAVIGLPGYDPRTEGEVPSSAVSVMSYCPGYTWIQPTAYLAILDDRRTASTLRLSREETTPSAVAAVVMGQVSADEVSVDQVRTSHHPRGVSPDSGAVRVRLLAGDGQELLRWHLAVSAIGHETSAGILSHGYAGVIPVPAAVAPLVRHVAVSTGARETMALFRLEPDR